MTTALMSPGSHVTDLRTAINLTFVAQLHMPTNLCPAFSLNKLRSILSSSWDTSLLSSWRWPQLGKTLSCFTPLLPSSLRLHFVSSERHNLVCLGPPGQVFLYPWALVTIGYSYTLYLYLIFLFYWCLRFFYILFKVKPPRLIRILTKPWIFMSLNSFIFI